MSAPQFLFLTKIPEVSRESTSLFIESSEIRRDRAHSGWYGPRLLIEFTHIEPRKLCFVVATIDYMLIQCFLNARYCCGKRKLIFFFKDFIYLVFRERGREGEREGEKHQWVIVPHASPTGDPAHNPGMCPDWESNQQSFGLEACAQSTELHQPVM